MPFTALDRGGPARTHAARPPIGAAALGVVVAFAACTPPAPASRPAPPRRDRAQPRLPARAAPLRSRAAAPPPRARRDRPPPRARPRPTWRSPSCAGLAPPVRVRIDFVRAPASTVVAPRGKSIGGIDEVGGLDDDNLWFRRRGWLQRYEVGRDKTHRLARFREVVNEVYPLSARYFGALSGRSVFMIDGRTRRAWPLVTLPADPPFVRLRLDLTAARGGGHLVIVHSGVARDPDHHGNRPRLHTDVFTAAPGAKRPRRIGHYRGRLRLREPDAQGRIRVESGPVGGLRLQLDGKTGRLLRTDKRPAYRDWPLRGRPARTLRVPAGIGTLALLPATPAPTLPGRGAFTADAVSDGGRYLKIERVATPAGARLINKYAQPTEVHRFDRRTGKIACLAASPRGLAVDWSRTNAILWRRFDRRPAPFLVHDPRTDATYELAPAAPQTAIRIDGGYAAKGGRLLLSVKTASRPRERVLVDYRTGRILARYPGVGFIAFVLRRFIVHRRATAGRPPLSLTVYPLPQVTPPARR